MMFKNLLYMEYTNKLKNTIIQILYLKLRVMFHLLPHIMSERIYQSKQISQYVNLLELLNLLKLKNQQRKTIFPIKLLISLVLNRLIQSYQDALVLNLIDLGFSKNVKSKVKKDQDIILRTTTKLIRNKNMLKFIKLHLPRKQKK